MFVLHTDLFLLLLLVLEHLLEVPFDALQVESFHEVLPVGNVFNLFVSLVLFVFGCLELVYKHPKLSILVRYVAPCTVVTVSHVLVVTVVW